MLPSSEDVTILEFTGDVVVTNEPLKFVLVYTIGHGITEAIDESIQTRFGGVGLPTSIKYLEELITNGSNVVAVKVNLRLTTFLTVCLLYTSPSPRDRQKSRMPSSA